MIAIFSVFFVISIIAFAFMRKLKLGKRVLLSLLVFIIPCLIVTALLVLVEDKAPEGSRVVTQDELNRAAEQASGRVTKRKQFTNVEKSNLNIIVPPGSTSTEPDGDRYIRLLNNEILHEVNKHVMNKEYLMAFMFLEEYHLYYIDNEASKLKDILEEIIQDDLKSINEGTGRIRIILLEKALNSYQDGNLIAAKVIIGALRHPRYMTDPNVKACTEQSLEDLQNYDYMIKYLDNPPFLDPPTYFLFPEAEQDDEKQRI